MSTLSDTSDLSRINVEVTNPETPFGGVQVFGGDPLLDLSAIRVEVTNPETPFGGVQVFDAGDTTVLIDLEGGNGAGSGDGGLLPDVPVLPVTFPVTSVFGRLGDITALATDYAAFYQPLGAYEAALGNPSSNGYVLSSSTAGVRSWIAPPTGGSGATEVWSGPDAPTPQDDYLVWIDTDAPDTGGGGGGGGGDLTFVHNQSRCQRAGLWRITRENFHR